MHAWTHARTHTNTHTGTAHQWQNNLLNCIFKCWKDIGVTWRSGTGVDCACLCRGRTCVCQTLNVGPLIKVLLLISWFGFCFCPFGSSLSSYDESQKVKRSQVFLDGECRFEVRA